MPMWEDPVNAEGGALFLDLPQLYHHLQVDTLMEETLCVVMGNQLAEWDRHITGVIANGRRVCIWMTCSDGAEVEAMSRVLREKLISNVARYKFVPHVERNAKSCSRRYNNAGTEGGANGENRREA
jgi:Eukaryotic initiation factor 4E